MVYPNSKDAKTIGYFSGWVGNTYWYTKRPLEYDDLWNLIILLEEVRSGNLSQDSNAVQAGHGQQGQDADGPVDHA